VEEIGGFGRANLPVRLAVGLAKRLEEMNEEKQRVIITVLGATKRVEFSSRERKYGRRKLAERRKEREKERERERERRREREREEERAREREREKMMPTVPSVSRG